MMILTCLCLLAAALWADVYIFVHRLSKLRGPWNRVLPVLMLLPDLCAAAMPVLYMLSDNRDPLVMHMLMWCNYAFFLALLSKLLIASGVLLSRRTGMRAFGAAAWVLSLLTVAAMVYGATAGRSRIRVERIEVCSPRLPESFDGMRIVQFSDLHLGSLIRPERFIAALCDTISSLRPDIVANTGDLVNIRCTELSDRFMSLLSRIEAPEGVYSVLGNHDLGFYIKDTLRLSPRGNVQQLVALQQELGWRMLCDTSVCLRRGADSILLTGLNFPEQAHLHGHNSTLAGADLQKAYAGADTSLFNLVLAHAPQLWSMLCEQGLGDLTLSGHVHAMQAKLHLPGGACISPARAVYRQWSGLYRCGGRVLYVNDGLGCVMYPMRIGARPEVTLIELRRCE